VARLARADELVVRDVEELPGLAESLARLVGPLPRRDAVLLGGPLDLEAVLVGAGEEDDIVTPQPPPASQRVGGERGVGVADVRRVVDVVDRRRQIERLGHRATIPTALSAF
jgi:hypothetical protein